MSHRVDQGSHRESRSMPLSRIGRPFARVQKDEGGQEAPKGMSAQDFLPLLPPEALLAPRGSL